MLAIQSHLRVFAYCDVPPSFLEQARLRAPQQALSVRLFFHDAPGRFIDAPLPIGEHGLFLDVPFAGVICHAELGFMRTLGADSWEVLLRSEHTEIPPAPESARESQSHATTEILGLVRDALQKHVPLTDLLDHLHSSGQLSENELNQLAESPWPGREATLLQQLVRNLANSPSPTSWGEAAAIKAKLGDAAAKVLLAHLPTSPGQPTSPVTPGTAAGSPAGFWFNINVEVIVYGATEPDAKVTLAGQKVTLRKDGTFSQRYILPDGAFHLEASAEPQDGRERREVALQLSRATALTGEVGSHPQDPALKAPGKA